MKTKKVNRYYCDHCNKGGGSAGHMRRHEERCTLNPQRVCGMCRFDEFDERDPKPLAELVALLPDPEKHRTSCYEVGEGGRGSYTGLTEAIKLIWADFEKAADECPACMLAAIRQAGLGDGLIDGELFDYKKAADGIFAEHRYAEQEAYG